MSAILRVVLFIVFAGVQFCLPFAALRWGFGLDDEWCLLLSWAWAVVMIVLEGVFYITGAIFYSFNKTRYMHTVFHFCVLAGSICHIIAVWDILIRGIF